MSLASGVGCPACHDTIPRAPFLSRLSINLHLKMAFSAHLGFSVQTGAKDSGDLKQAASLSFTVLKYEIRWLDELTPKDPSHLRSGKQSSWSP